jgi:hypothetical protein
MNHMIEEIIMNKLRVGILFGIFALVSFTAMNLYTATSFPGFGGNETCNNCHNQPIFAKNVDVSFQLGDWAGSTAAFNDGKWATNEVPVIQTNNRSDANLEFIKTVFLTNSTHFMAMFEVDDTTPSYASSATSDKFGVIFNIDEANFTVGDFLNTYNSSATNLDKVLDGQMGFKGDGHADLWWIDMADTKVNTTGKAMDYYISTNYLSDGSTKQDVSYAVWYGLLAVHGPTKVYGYRIWFVRSLTTNDSNDAQFKVGTGVHYAIASWDNSAAEYHHSSFDQMVVIGNELGGVSISTVTVTGETKTSGTASAFTAAFVLAGLAVAIPVISKMRRRKE